MPSLLYYPHLTIGSVIIPDKEEIRHLKALRIREGDEVMVTNGLGTRFACIVNGHLSDLTLHVQREEVFPPRIPALSVAIAPTKNPDRLEWFIEKSVEIGVEHIHLVLCDNSERPKLKTDRLERLAIAAMKQSQKYRLPVIHQMIAFSDFINQDFGGQKFIAHCNEDDRKQSLKTAMKKGLDTLICIGPEGDFSPREIALAEQAQFKPVSLGTSRLRTETAGIVAVHSFDFQQQ